MQLQMLQWLRFYKMLNEMPMTDRPDDDTITDDEQLDRWYTNYIRQLQQDAARAGNSRGPEPTDFELPTFSG